MRLTELEPHWVTFGSAGTTPEFKGKRWYIGFSFLCPHCLDERLAIFFENEIDDGVSWAFNHWDTYKDRNGGHPLWKRQGETFETLTLMPSIDGSGVGHWHGSITNGEVA